MKFLGSFLFFIVFIGFAEASYGQDFEDTKVHAEHGDAQAQYTLGVMYDHGVGVPKNDEEAVKWYRLAAEQGDPMGQVALGAIYSAGSSALAEDDAAALEWFRRAAEQGDAMGQAALGVMYDRGEGVRQSNIHAYVWFLIAAKNGLEFASESMGVVSERLTAEQLAQGQDIATKCIDSNFKDCE